MKENKGLTMVELITAIAIMALVSLGVVTFLDTSLGAYDSAGSEVDLQYEAQLAVNQLKDLIIDTNGGISYQVGVTGEEGRRLVLKDEELAPGEQMVPAVKSLYLYHREQEKLFLTEISWREDTGEISYSKREAGAETAGAEKYLMAEKVSSFSVDLTQVERDRKVTFIMTFSVKKKQYTAEHAITLRNRVRVNDLTDDELLEDLPDSPDVTGVTVTGEQYMYQGSSQTLQAVVAGGASTSQLVTWSLTGATDSGTRINPDTGELVLGTQEKSDNLQITAVSSQDTTAAGVFVVHTRYLEAITLEITETDTEAKDEWCRFSVVVTGRYLTGKDMEVSVERLHENPLVTLDNVNTSLILESSQQKEWKQSQPEMNRDSSAVYKYQYIVKEEVYDGDILLTALSDSFAGKKSNTEIFKRKVIVIDKPEDKPEEKPDQRPDWQSWRGEKLNMTLVVDEGTLADDIKWTAKVDTVPSGGSVPNVNGVGQGAGQKGFELFFEGGNGKFDWDVSYIVTVTVEWNGKKKTLIQEIPAVEAIIQGPEGEALEPGQEVSMYRGTEGTFTGKMIGLGGEYNTRWILTGSTKDGPFLGNTTGKVTTIQWPWKEDTQGTQNLNLTFEAAAIKGSNSRTVSCNVRYINQRQP